MSATAVCGKVNPLGCSFRAPCRLLEYPRPRGREDPDPPLPRVANLLRDAARGVGRSIAPQVPKCPVPGGAFDVSSTATHGRLITLDALDVLVGYDHLFGDSLKATPPEQVAHRSFKRKNTFRATEKDGSRIVVALTLANGHSNRFVVPLGDLERGCREH